MPLFDQLYGPHADLLSSAMAQASRRHGLLSKNLANINTPGYKRQDSEFTVQLDEATGRFPRLRHWQQRARDRAAGEVSIRVDGNSVDMEREVLAIAETELRYQALADMTSRYFSGLKIAIREGR